MYYKQQINSQKPRNCQFNIFRHHSAFHHLHTTHMYSQHRMVVGWFTNEHNYNRSQDLVFRTFGFLYLCMGTTNKIDQSHSCDSGPVCVWVTTQHFVHPSMNNISPPREMKTVPISTRLHFRCTSYIVPTLKNCSGHHLERIPLL